MNGWLAAACALTLGYLCCGIVLARRRLLDRFVAAEMATLITVLELELLAQGFGSAYYFDLALAVALLSFPAGVLYVYFYIRWL